MESEGIEGERMGKTGRGREIERGRDSGGESLRRKGERMGKGGRARMGIAAPYTLFGAELR